MISGRTNFQSQEFEFINGAVHLWIARLADVRGSIELYRRYLSATERERAARLHSVALTEGFTLRRAILRSLLGHYLGIDPSEVTLAQGTNGKPRLVNESCNLRFNASASAGLAVYGISQGCELGVDVEQEKPLDDIADVTNRFFSRGERDDLSKLPVQQRQAGFYACWTRKEAYVKALGKGLSVPLEEFRVSVEPDGPALLLESWPGDQDGKWTLHSLAHPGYRIALAYRGERREVSVRPFESEPASAS